MSRFDMKEFGEAAPFLRKSELELLTAHTVPFDGRVNIEKKTKNKKQRNLGENHFKYIQMRN